MSLPEHHLHVHVVLVRNNDLIFPQKYLVIRCVHASERDLLPHQEIKKPLLTVLGALSVVIHQDVLLQAELHDGDSLVAASRGVLQVEADVPERFLP